MPKYSKNLDDAAKSLLMEIGIEREVPLRVSAEVEIHTCPRSMATKEINREGRRIVSRGVECPVTGQICVNIDTCLSVQNQKNLNILGKRVSERD